VPSNSEAIQKAREYSERKFTLAMDQIVVQSQKELAAEQNRRAAMGSILSGAMWQFTAQHLIKQIETLIRARLSALLDGYELFNVTIDDKIEQEILQDITNLREVQITNAKKFVSSQPWLGPDPSAYIAGQLSSVSNFINEAKVEIAERRQRPKPLSANREPNEQLVFVSCGQSTTAERELGKAIAKLVEQETGCRAYFAENQNTLEGVTENILKRLHDAAAFIAIMHPRGDVSNPNNKNAQSWVRGSVWVEQEIAIAAFISQALQRPLKVRSYVHQNIQREGLRDKLHLNPFLFREDSEILNDLTSFLRQEWQDLGQHRRKDPLSLKANISHRRESIPGGSKDPADERHMLLVNIENDGEQDARDFQLDVEFPSTFVDEGGHALQVSASKPGTVLYRIANTFHKIEHLYPTGKTPDLISFHYAVLGKTKREHPELLLEKVTATVYSGNMKPKVTTKTIAELLG